MEKYDCLKLENQLCFPLYACARSLVKKYNPHLTAIGLTYTQYIAMMVFWEKGTCSAKELGELLYLDSGTLTPVLKSLEQKGLVKRCRSNADERVLMIEITAQGQALKDRAVEIPAKIAPCVNLTPDEAKNLYQALQKILAK
ncbi:MAG: MarR family transcriptional regulator [Eubacteriales bacterium]|nr:MarR family transcriptional regulator [Eubacteriales bacterium]